MGVDITQFAVGGPIGEPIVDTSFSGRTFTVKVYRCKTCGYVELFDDEVSNG